jgi:hypothetical protein
VLVGEERKPFAVHEDLLLTEGLFFKAALSHDWKEKQDRTIKLPYCHPSTFNIYAKWLYSGQFCVIEDTEERETPLNLSAEWVSLKQSYIMADYVLSTDFKDAVIDAIIEKMIDKNKCPTMVIELIYSRTTDKLPHRKVVREVMLKTWKDAQYQELRELNLTREDLLDLLIIVGTGSKGRYVHDTHMWDAFNHMIPCAYHEHTLTGAVCYRAKYNR